MKIIGLTGMSGSGKTTVSNFLKDNGFQVVNCDNLAKETIKTKPCIDEVRRLFPEIFTDGEFDRKKAAYTVFSDELKRDEYQKAVFPYIVFRLAETLRVLEKSGNTNSVLLDAPTLFESKINLVCDRIISVIADDSTCVNRIMKRDNITEGEAVMRLSNQLSGDFFKNNSDLIIENNSSPEELYSLIEKIGGII